MQRWSEQVEGHTVFSALKELEGSLQSTKEASRSSEELIESWDRASAIHMYVTQLLTRANPFLLPLSSLNNLANSAVQARAELEGFRNTSNITHLMNAVSHLDSCLVHASQLPQLTVETVGNLREAASSYRASVGQLVSSMRKDIEGASVLQSELQRRIDEATNEISQQKGRLDTAIATFQQQFSEAQQARQTEYAAAEQSRTNAADMLEKQRQSIFDSAEQERKQSALSAASSMQEQHQDLMDALSETGSQFLDAMEEQKRHAQKLIGIISDTGMAYGFQKTANEERAEAATWKRIAALSLVAWILVGGVFFALTYDRDLTLAAVGRQLLLSTPFVLLSGFAALQVKLHQRNERQLRQAELEIASIDPFLATLSDQDRNEVKREFASRYFGRRETDGKEDSRQEQLWDLIHSLTKLVQDATKKN